MRRLANGVLVLAFLGACGGSTPAATSTTPAAATSAAPATTATTAPTAAASSARPSSAAPTIAFQDTKFTGTWTNQTFGSTGPATFDVKVDRTAPALNVTITLGGNVFGAPAPAPETFTVPVSAAGGATFSGKSKTFGDVTATMKDGKITMACANVPGGRVKSMDVTGTYSATAIDMSYTVALSDGSTAKGVVNLKKA